MLEGYEHAYLRFVRTSWQEINHRFLQGRLRPPVFALSEGKQRLGFWQRDSRTLTLSAHIFLHHGALEVKEVLKHEMAHQYADEVLDTAASETPHGSAFGHACRLLGIQHHARFRRKAEPPPILAKVRKLLALADSGNVHEAEAAMAKAKQLMDRLAPEATEGEDEFAYRFLGRPYRRRTLVSQLLVSLLTDFFHVEAVWIPTRTVTGDKRVWVLEICGTPVHLKVAAYVYDFLQRELAWLWQEHRRARPELKGAGPKRDYQVGLLKGLTATLAREEAAPTAPPAPGALVLHRRERLSAFLRQRHPQLRAGRKSSYRLSDQYRAGYAKGRTIRIRKGLAADEENGPSRLPPEPTLAIGKGS